MGGQSNYVSQDWSSTNVEVKKEVQLSLSFRDEIAVIEEIAM